MCNGVLSLSISVQHPCARYVRCVERVRVCVVHPQRDATVVSTACYILYQCLLRALCQSRGGHLAGDEMLATRIEIFTFAAWIRWQGTLSCLVVLVNRCVSVPFSARHCTAHMCVRKSLCAQVCVRVHQVA